MAKEEKKDTKKWSDAPAVDQVVPLSEAVAVPVAPAEPKIPFQEFAMTKGLDRILLAGFAAHDRARQGVTHRTQAEWMEAYQAFGRMPA